MNKTDALVAAIGAGVLVVALAGAALTGTGGGTQYDVRWTDNSAEHDVGSETLQQSGEVELAYGNPHANTTALHFEVAVTVPQGHVGAQADTFTVIVTSPQGVETTADGVLPAGATGGTGIVGVDVDLGTAPTAATASGTSPAAAAASLAATHTNLTGVGNWTVLVQLTHNGVAPTTAHTVVVSVEAHWYTAEVQATVPTAR